MADPRKTDHFTPILLGLTLLSIPLLFGCGDGGGNPDPDPDPPKADSIALSPDSISFDAIGDTLRVTAVVLDQYGDVMPGIVIIWASDDATVAGVDQTGLVTSVRNGETEVRAQGGTVRNGLSVEVGQEAYALEILAGENQFHWTGFLLRDTLKISLADRAGSAVVGEEVTWEVLDGEGSVFPEATRTDSEGEVRALWVLGEGESGVQRASATVLELDPVIFEATGSAAITLLNAGPLTGAMLDTLTATLLTRDSLGVPEFGIPMEFQDITGFGEIVQGPTASDINGEMEAKWALGPTPGPQRVTAVRTDIGAELELLSEATGVLDPWPFTIVSPGFYHTCAIDTDDAAYCWGLNTESQLTGVADTMPDGQSLPVEAPMALLGALTWDEIGGGEFHSCGLTTGGRVYCWGAGFQTGQDGDGTQIISDPTAVGAASYKALAVGGYHNCAIKPDGTAWCWGAGGLNQLGNGALDSIPAPAAVSGGYLWNDLSAGHMHTCGITETADAYCWGLGTEGQLGYGGIEDQEAPALVAGGIDWMKISAGRFHSCGISTAGEAFCWGEGGFNQLGIGSTADQTSPVRVVGGHQWTDINAGQFHTCGVDSQDKLYCWGRGGFVGLGVFGSPTPAVVLPAYDWESVQTQGIHTCAITTAGETYCWGSNASGQLGIGNTDDFLVPRIVIRGLIGP